MKRFGCLLLTVLILVGTAGAYNGDIIVYITNSGSKYHSAGCSYLKSSNPTSLEDAVSRGYTPCSRCGPPSLDVYSGNNTRGSFTNIAPQPVGRIQSIMKDKKPLVDVLKQENNDLRDIAESRKNRIQELQQERDQVLQQKEEAEREAAAVQKELDTLKRNLFIASMIVGFVGFPLYCIWFANWKKKEIERITAAVRVSMEAAPKTDCTYNPQQKSMPPPKPAPKASPPPVRNAYDLKRENSYLREAYRQRYEGKSIAEEAGVPKECGVWFDTDGFPHRKSRQKTDEFTVYITDKGKSYHTANCPSAKYGRAVNICYAKERGLGPCGRCRPIENLPHWITEYQRIFRICKAFGIDIKP